MLTETVSHSDRLRDATRDVHIQAERSGVVSDLLKQRGTREDYIALLRNLHPVYTQLESSLSDSSIEDGIRWFARRELSRVAAIENDLVRLAGAQWRERIKLLPEAQAYASSIRSGVKRAPLTLVSHCYVRYLGDLSGGQLIKGVLERSLGLDPVSLTFFEFPLIEDLDQFKRDFRRQINRVAEGVEAGTADILIDAALDAFRMNIALSKALQDRIR